MRDIIFPLSGMRKVAGKDKENNTGRQEWISLMDSSPTVKGRKEDGYSPFVNWLSTTSFGGANPERSNTQAKLRYGRYRAMRRADDRALEARDLAENPQHRTGGLLRDFGRSAAEAAERGANKAKQGIDSGISGAKRSAGKFIENAKDAGMNAVRQGARKINPVLERGKKYLDSTFR